MFGPSRDQRCDHQSLTQVQTPALLLLETYRVIQSYMKQSIYQQESSPLVLTNEATQIGQDTNALECTMSLRVKVENMAPAVIIPT